MSEAARPRHHVHLLHPGDVACVDRDERLETLLGSCVAIVLTDPRRTVGAMCHVVHAGHPARGVAESNAFGRTAMDTLARRLRARGIEHEFPGQFQICVICHLYRNANPHIGFGQRMIDHALRNQRLVRHDHLRAVFSKHGA